MNTANCGTNTGRIKSTAVESLITYDYASRITGVTLGNLSTLSGTKTYGYDVLDRLTSYTGAGGPISYSYDANGNRLTGNVNGTASTTTMGSASNRIT